MREGVTENRTLFTHYRQVKNPNPVFTPREGK
ncbi:incFII family plasmid replication initiator RepA, partial [Klebsiella pneumoniae]|nr:incFII family plasmid replication initiator RepA [Klebsiella pneumoniae]